MTQFMSVHFALFLSFKQFWKLHKAAILGVLVESEKFRGSLVLHGIPKVIKLLLGVKMENYWFGLKLKGLNRRFKKNGNDDAKSPT